MNIKTHYETIVIEHGEPGPVDWNVASHVIAYSPEDAAERAVSRDDPLLDTTYTVLVREEDGDGSVTAWHVRGELTVTWHVDPTEAP